MLARDWYYNERRQIGLDSAVASICDRHDDSDIRARAALTMLGVQRGWRVADIGCGNGVLACEAALIGAEVDAIDISPAMLALAEIQARDRKVAIRTQSAGLLSFAYQPDTYDLIVSEFALHHLPDFWKAVALSRIFCALKPGASFYLRDIVFVSMPDGTRARHRGVGGLQHQEPRLLARQRRHPYARRVFDLRLGDRADADRCRLHAGLGRLSRAAARHLSVAETETRRAGLGTSMKPADVFLAVLVAVTWGLGFVASRLALDELSPALMTAMRFAIAARAVPVRAPSEGFLGGADRDQRHAVSRPVSGAVLGDRAQRPGRPHQRDRAEPGAVHGGVCRAGVSRDSHAHADRRHRRCRDRPVDDLRHRRFRFQRRRLRGAVDLAGQLCDRQSAAAAGEGRADVRSVRLAVPGAAAAVAGAGACRSTGRGRPGNR